MLRIARGDILQAQEALVVGTLHRLDNCELFTGHEVRLRALFVKQQTCLLCTQQTRLLCHIADMSAVSHSRRVCCITQQTCLLCHTAGFS